MMMMTVAEDEDPHGDDEMMFTLMKHINVGYDDDDDDDDFCL